VSIAVIAAYALNRMVKNNLWLDELVMLIVSGMDVVTSITQTLDYSAPLYQLILKPFVINGYQSEFLLRTPSLLSAFAGIIYTWKVAALAFSRTVAAFSVILVTVNPHFLYYSAEARPYMLFFFVTCACFYHFIRCIHGELKPHGFLYIRYDT
jgi:uncharacterized membrane protein